MDTLELVEAEAEPGELEFVTGASARSRLVKVIMSEESFKSLRSPKTFNSSQTAQLRASLSTFAASEFFTNFYFSEVFVEVVLQAKLLQFGSCTDIEYQLVQAHKDVHWIVIQ